MKKSYSVGCMIIMTMLAMAATARAQLVYGKLTVAATATVQLDPTYNDATGVTKQPHRVHAHCRL